jgi:Phosphate-selective porin O and P
MQRHLMFASFATLALLAAPVHGQPAPTPPAEPPNSPTEPVAPPPTSAPPPATERSAEAKPAEPTVRKIAVAKDSPGASISLGLLMQSWFVYDLTSPEVGGETVNLSTSTFRIRRLEISANGDLIPKFIRYRFMFDPWRVRDTLNTATAVNAAGQPVTVSTPASPLSTLQDFYITFQSDLADVSIGQFKNQISWDGFNSAAKIIMPERAFVANVVGGQRDLGVRLDKTFKMFGYSLGIYNGAGQNNFDNNNQKDVGLRLEVYPVPGMTIAGVTYDSIGYRSRARTKDRWEGDFRYETGPYLIQSELIRAHDVSNSTTSVDSQGFYVALAYLMKDVGSGNWKGNLQPVLRFGFFDPNVDADVDPTMVPASSFGGNDERMDYEVGLNYYLRNHEVKLQASYDRQQFDQKTANNEVILAGQIWF